MATAGMSVGQIAAKTPSAVKVFEKYGIDFCCGGNRQLGEVCQERGLQAPEVLAEIAQAGQKAEDGRDWTSTSLRELSEHILTTHHQYLWNELPNMEARMAKVMQAHGERFPEPLAGLFAGLKDELEGHLKKEEMILFPYIAALEAGRAPRMPFGSVRNPIQMMLHEHDSAGTVLAEMRRLTKDYQVPAEACNTWRALYHELEQLEADLHVHIHLENNILFPRAAELENATA